MNTRFRSPEQTSRKPTKVVSGTEEAGLRRKSDETGTGRLAGRTCDRHQAFDGVVVHVQVMRFRRSRVVFGLEGRPADSGSTSCENRDRK